MQRKSTRIFVATFLAFIVAIAASSSPALAQKSSSKAKTETSAASSKSSSQKSGKLDINSASKEDLEALPGIGPVMSQKIIDNRPYRAKSDLVKRNVIPKSEYEKIKDQIIAHQKK